MAVLSVSVCHGATGQAFRDGGGWIEAPNGSWVVWSLHSGSHGYRRLLSVLRVSKNLSKRLCHCARIRLRELYSFSRVQLSFSSFFIPSFLAFRFRAFLILTRFTMTFDCYLMYLFLVIIAIRLFENSREKFIFIRV